MSLPASDDFNRADANPISGGNWTALTGNLKIESNMCKGTIFAFNLGYWSADSFGNDQYAQHINPVLSDGGPCVRVTAGSNCYWYNVKPSSSNLQKVTAGGFSTLQSGMGVPGTTDVTYIEVVGTTIKCKIAGTQTGTDQVDSAWTTGSAGLLTYDGTSVMDDFLADTIGPPGASAVATNYRQFPKFLLRR